MFIFTILQAVVKLNSPFFYILESNKGINSGKKDSILHACIIILLYCFFRSIRPWYLIITGSLVGVGITIGMLLTLLTVVVATRVARNRRRPVQRPPHSNPNEAGDVELQELNVISP